jgi:peptidoglycan/xylan/chitin deacetylase (PgdA/CDA1 family)
VALTFDDGPDPVWTPLVLDALAGASATFFVVAPLADRYPSLPARMREEGHEVAFHCTRHARHDDSTHEEIEADVEQVLLTLGGSVRYWRTP